MREAYCSWCGSCARFDGNLHYHGEYYCSDYCEKRHKIYKRAEEKFGFHKTFKVCGCYPKYFEKLLKKNKIDYIGKEDTIIFINRKDEAKCMKLF